MELNPNSYHKEIVHVTVFVCNWLCVTLEECGNTGRVNAKNCMYTYVNSAHVSMTLGFCVHMCSPYIVYTILPV